MQTNNVLIIEDHPLYRDALIVLLKDSVPTAEIATAASAEEGLRVAANLPKLQLIMLDLSLPGLSGTEAVADFLRVCPTAIIIVISSSEDRRDVSAALRMGARAFISKHVARPVMMNTVRRAFSGELVRPEWIRPSHGSVFMEKQTLPLSQRQMEIVTFLSRGHSNKEIAAQVGLAEITVKQHLSAIFRVLGVDNRAQAVLAIRRFGLAEKSDEEDL